MPEKERFNIASGSPWEPLRGYSRAVRINDSLFISGTTSIDDRGEVVGPGDPYEQTKYVISVVRRVLAVAGFAMTDVVRTRMFITSMNDWKHYALAHREAFENIRPASSIVQVAKLVDPRLMVELEVDAIKGCALAGSLQVKYRE